MRYAVETETINDILQRQGRKHVFVAGELEYTALQWSRTLNGERRFVNRTIANGPNAGKTRAVRLGEILGVTGAVVLGYFGFDDGSEN